MSKKQNDKYTYGQFIKDHIKSTIILILIPVIGISVFVPLLCCEKIPINDLGSFLGGLLAYIGTVLLGSISVWQNEKFKKMSDYKDEMRDREIKESQRLSIQPYLFCEYVEVNLNEIITDKAEFIHVNNFEEDGNGYPFCLEAPIDIQAAFEEKTEYGQLRNAEKYILTKFKVTNIGQAGAINILFEINKRRTLTPFSIIKEATKIIYILFEIDRDFVGSKEIDLNFFYNDIQGVTNYKQQFSILLGKNEDDFVYTAQGKAISAPTIDF